jgi:hypothetical protein
MRTPRNPAAHLGPHQFRPGNSGNPSGMTARKRAQLLAAEVERLTGKWGAEFRREYRRFHRRRLPAGDKATIQGAAALAAQIECGRLPDGTRLNPDDIVRLSNALRRMLAQVGLAPRLPGGGSRRPISPIPRADTDYDAKLDAIRAAVPPAADSEAAE